MPPLDRRAAGRKAARGSPGAGLGRAPRAAAFTLIEIVIALSLLSIVFLTIATSYKTGLFIQAGSMSYLPMAAANANMSTTLRDSVRSATCLQSPAAGGFGPTLLGWFDRDCDPLTGTFDGGPGSYFVACLTGAGGQVLFQTGTGTPAAATITCGVSGATPWSTLTPLNVTAADPSGGTNIFSRPLSAGNNNNVVWAQMQLTYPMASSAARQWSASADAGANPSILWVSTFTAQRAALQ